MEKKKKQIKKKKTNTTKKKTTTQKKKTTSTNKNIPKKEVKKINKEAPKVVKTEIKEIPKVIIPEVKENKLDKYNKIIISLINILYLELIYHLFVFKTFEFKEALERRTGLPVILWDERLTSVSAENIMIESKIRRENRKQYVDEIAAMVILQNYLESLHN